MNVEVPPEPGGIASHPRMKNPSSSLQLQQPGGGNGDPTCRYRPAGCRKPNSTGRFLFHGPSARKNGTPFANVEVPPLPGEIGCHLRRRNHSTSLQHQHPGGENEIIRVNTPRRMWKLPPHWLLADSPGLMEPERIQSFPSGQRPGPAAIGDDRASSLQKKYFHISTTPTTLARKRRSPKSIPADSRMPNRTG